MIELTPGAYHVAYMLTGSARLATVDELALAVQVMDALRSVGTRNPVPGNGSRPGYHLESMATLDLGPELRAMLHRVLTGGVGQVPTELGAEFLDLLRQLEAEP